MRSFLTGILLLLVAAATAGCSGSAKSAQTPSPEAMGPYRCAEAPFGLGLSAGVPLETGLLPGTVLEAALPEDLAAALSKVPNAEAVAQALAAVHAKAGEAVPARAAAGLAAGGQPVIKLCKREASEKEDFIEGCRHAAGCDLVLTLEGKRVVVSSLAELAEVLRPVDSKAEALGIAALADRWIWLPLNESEKAEFKVDHEDAQWTPVDTGLPLVEIEEHEAGYLVRAPRYVTCGCKHDLIRVAYWVSRSGAVCNVDEDPVTLAVSQNLQCVD